MEFKVGGKKLLWTALAPKEMQPCEASVMEKLCRGEAHYFAVVIAWRNQGHEDGRRAKRNKKLN